MKEGSKESFGGAYAPALGEIRAIANTYDVLYGMAWALLVGIALSACAIPVKQVPLTSPITRAEGKSFTLNEEVAVGIGTGYGRTLRAGTKWNLFGSIAPGDVYRSPDQVLTVEGYNVHEAYIVVSDHQLVGFYLPVEKSFTPARKSVPLPADVSKE
jgi:hypothetical protein